MTTAATYFRLRHGNDQFLSQDAILKLMDDYAYEKWLEWKNSMEQFNSEQFLSQHNLEQIRKQFKKDKENPPQ